MRAELFVLLFMLASCTAHTMPNDSADESDLSRGMPADLGPANRLVADFPYDYKVPTSYDQRRPTPLVVLLHGFGLSGSVQDSYFNLGKLVDDRGFLFAYPDATDTGQVDDMEYLGAVLGDMTARYNVDPKRIFLVGHSDGGFLAHHYACAHTRQIAAVVALAGSNWKDPADCQAATPLAVLQVHGDADAIIEYNGRGQSFPSAFDSMAIWGAKNHCRDTPDKSVTPFDLDQVAPGPETVVDRWVGCQAGGAAELWTMRGVGLARRRLGMVRRSSETLNRRFRRSRRPRLGIALVPSPPDPATAPERDFRRSSTVRIPAATRLAMILRS